jgi:hypothetical protein
MLSREDVWHLGNCFASPLLEEYLCLTFRNLVLWASSSVRIEHQPPKLGVEGSNPSPPATDAFEGSHGGYLRFQEIL